MATRIQSGTKPRQAKRAQRPRYATKLDIAQITAALDRVRDDDTRYLICMTVDLITQRIAERAGDSAEDEEDQPIAN